MSEVVMQRLGVEGGSTVTVRCLCSCGRRYLSRKLRRAGGGASGVTGRVGEGLAGLKRRLLLLSHDLLGGWKTLSVTQPVPTIGDRKSSPELRPLTLREDAVDVEAVGGAGLVEQRVTHVDAQLPSSLVVNDSRVTAADFI